MASVHADLVAYVLPHTHWDREWYQTAERFRQRLVALVDELLDDRDAPSFLLDGQAVVLDDYLAVRPERRAELAQALAAGEMEAGPWYVLADELIPSGESLIRNLLAGRRTVAALDSRPPDVLYCPDSFGHPAALPLLAQGFGFGLVIVWRGYGGARWPMGDTARWRSVAHDPETSDDSVVLFHLPPQGYELGSNLPVDPIAAGERWNRMFDVLEPRSRTGALLIQNGADHHALQHEWRQATDAMAKAAAPVTVRAVSLGAFAAEFERRAALATLPEVQGELRDSYGYTWTLQGTFATRASQKRTNAAVERVLLREAEPWSALARRAGGASRDALLRAAWRDMLLTHPHDTLCGCSIDEVADEAARRWRGVLVQAHGVRDDSLLDLAGHRPDVARERPEDWHPALVIRNASLRPRGGVAEVELESPIGLAPVGPSSANAVPIPAMAPNVPTTGLALQLVDTSIAHRRVESARHYPVNELAAVHRALVYVPAIAAFGTFACALNGGVRSPGPAAPARAARRSLQNGHLEASVSAEGAILLGARGESPAISRLLVFESVTDAGDLYTPSLRGEPVTAAFRGARCVARGPLRAAVETRWRLRLPAHGGLTPAASLATTPPRADASRVNLDITATLELDADARFLRVRIAGDNTACDHRLRVRFDTGLAEARLFADAAFGTVERVTIDVPDEDQQRERATQCAPLHRYVSLFGHSAGVTLYSDGLAEYEQVAPGEIAITLVRAVGELSRADLPERPGHAGWPAPTPAAQSPGPFEAVFGVFLHGSRDRSTIDDIERVADDVLLPLQGHTIRDALTVPAPSAGVELEGVGLAFGCVRGSEDGMWTVLRCVNLCDEPVDGAWRLSPPLREARAARLDETAGSRLAVTADGRVAFHAPPRAVVTVLVR